MIWLILAFTLVVAIWGAATFLACGVLYKYGFVGDATLRARKIYLIISLIIIILGYIGILLV